MKKVIFAVFLVAAVLFLCLPNLSWAHADVYKVKCAGNETVSQPEAQKSATYVKSLGK